METGPNRVSVGPLNPQGNCQYLVSSSFRLNYTKGQNIREILQIKPYTAAALSLCEAGHTSIRGLFLAANMGLFWASLHISLPCVHRVLNRIFGDFPDSWWEQGVMCSVTVKCLISPLTASSTEPVGSHHFTCSHRNSAHELTLMPKTGLVLSLPTVLCIALMDTGVKYSFCN